MSRENQLQGKIIGLQKVLFPAIRLFLGVFPEIWEPQPDGYASGYSQSQGGRRSRTRRPVRPKERDHQESRTLPARPEFAMPKASWKSSAANRWVITGVTSRPDWSMAVILYQVSNISRP